MKIAALSDIHGNLFALDAVLEDVGRRCVDITVNLGDILSGALLPAETADRDIIHSAAIGFTVDGTPVRDARGMFGERLGRKCQQVGWRFGKSNSSDQPSVPYAIAV